MGSQPHSARNRGSTSTASRRARVADIDVAEHVRGALTGGPGRQPGRRQDRRRAGHRLTPACSRGPDTASTAARRRDGSGWEYTSEDDTEV